MFPKMGVQQASSFKEILHLAVHWHDFLVVSLVDTNMTYVEEDNVSYYSIKTLLKNH